MEIGLSPALLNLLMLGMLVNRDALRLTFYPTDCPWEELPTALKNIVGEYAINFDFIQREDAQVRPTSVPARPLLTYREGKLGVWRPEGMKSDFYAFDWSDLAKRWAKKSVPSGPLLKALNPKSLVFVVEATAGTGKDALFLSSLGHSVGAYERDPLVFLLLFDARLRLLHSADSSLAQLAERITLYFGDVKESESFKPSGPWGFFYDPMYKSSGGKGARKRDQHALPRKDMQLLRWREKVFAGGDHLEVLEMLQWASEQGAKRVILKRPLKAPETSLDGIPIRCEAIFKGKTTRYESFVSQTPRTL